MKNHKWLIFSIVFLPYLAFAQLEEDSTEEWNLNKSLALDGYDVVSYFNQGKPIKGKSSLKAAYKGAIYYFSSENNKQKFVKSPWSYLPEYGGWCAYAMGETGEKVKIDPETYKLVDGKLYLFYNFRLTNTLTKWNKNEKALKIQADQFWENIVAK